MTKYLKHQSTRENTLRSLFLVLCTSYLVLLFSCASDDHHYAPVIDHRDSLPVLQSVGVSTLISDSGIIRYRIISEDWFIYDRKQPTYWSFEKGLYIEKFDEQYHVDAFINCDTAYYFDQLHLWELRGRVLVKNLKGETFRTSLLYWNQDQHRIYSPAYMRIQGIDQELDGYNFSSNEQMTEYRIHSSSGAFPVDDDETPHPDEQTVAEHNDTTPSVATLPTGNKAPAANGPSIGIPPRRPNHTPRSSESTQAVKPPVNPRRIIPRK